MKQTKRLKSNK